MVAAAEQHEEVARASWEADVLSVERRSVEVAVVEVAPRGSSSLIVWSIGGCGDPGLRLDPARYFSRRMRRIFWLSGVRHRTDCSVAWSFRCSGRRLELKATPSRWALQSASSSPCPKTGISYATPDDRRRHWLSSAACGNLQQIEAPLGIHWLRPPGTSLPRLAGRLWNLYDDEYLSGLAQRRVVRLHTGGLEGPHATTAPKASSARWQRSQATARTGPLMVCGSPDTVRYTAQELDGNGRSRRV